VSEGKWPIVSLGELIDCIEAGSSFRCRETPPEADEVGVAKVSAVSWGYYNEMESKTCLDPSRIDKRLLIQKGDFLISRANTVQLVGACVIAERVSKRVMLSDKTLRIQLKDPSLKPWVLHFLRSREGRNQIEALCTGNQDSMRNISQKRLRQIEVPLAPPEEREQIIADLDLQLSRLSDASATFSHIHAKLKQARASILKAAVEGRLVEREAELALRTSAYFEDAQELLERVWIESMDQEPRHLKENTGIENFKRDVEGKSLPEPPYGWTWCRIDAVGTVQLGRQRSPKDHSGPNMCPYMRVANVFEDRIDLSDVKEMNFTPEEQDIYSLQQGDILLNEGQSPHLVGRPAMWRCELEHACFQNTLVRFRSSNAVLPRYALIVFRAQLHARRYMKIAKITTNIAHLGAQRFAAVEFPLPPFNEQQRIVEEVERRFSVLDQVAATVQDSLQRCGILRQAILKRAFGGQRGAGSEPENLRPNYIGSQASSLLMTSRSGI
jgi:type I restriction enzyme S subunit